MLYVPFPYAWGLVFVTVFFLFINTGPANTVLANVTRHRIRATAFAINILVIHALGDVISPPIIGLIADLSDLGTALLIVSMLILAGGILWLAGSRYLDEETRRDMQQWTGCIAGALTREDFQRELLAAGFEAVEVRETHRVHEHAASAIIRARVRDRH